MDNTMSCPKVGAFCQLFFAKEQRKALEGKPYRNLQVYFLLYGREKLPVMFLLQAFMVT